MSDRITELRDMVVDTDNGEWRSQRWREAAEHLEHFGQDDDAVSDFCGLLMEEIERLKACESHLARLEMLCRELDEELDGVKLPRSAAAVVNGIRSTLDDIDNGNEVSDE